MGGSVTGQTPDHARQQGRDTKPELAIRSLLHAAGFRYRVSARPEAEIARTADIVIRGPRVAVFIDGCFWHYCPDHGHMPEGNKEYWSEKLHRNRARDHETTRLLAERGWIVERHWEHEPVEDVLAHINRTVLDRRSPSDLRE